MVASREPDDRNSHAQSGGSRDPDTDELLIRAHSGDGQAVDRLVARHRSRLRRLIEVHLDRRLAARVDPSDIIQETLVDATRKLPRYLRERPLPFYPWLRQLALERIIRNYRQHVRAASRSVRREAAPGLRLPDHSAVRLAKLLVSAGSSPSHQLLREEQSAQVREVIENLSARDRDVLVLRFLEQLSTGEIAAVLCLTEAGVKSRLRRALERFTAAWRQRGGHE